MRYLAVARLRRLTTIRQATPVFLLTLLPPLGIAAIESLLESSYQGGTDRLLGFQAQVALIAWFFHTIFLLAAEEAFASRKMQSVDPANAPLDLMDSAPLPPKSRFGGEMLGIFTSTLIIHACCLPMLAVCAALSPLPARVFVWVEAGVLALMILGSAAAAWKRIARPTKMAATRNLRSGILFAIIVAAILFVSTRWTEFRDALFAFLGMPSMRAWSRVLAAIDSPVGAIVSVAVLYVVYFVFYFVSSTRDPLRA